MSVLASDRGVKINGVVGQPDAKGVGVHAFRATFEKSMEVGAGGRVELNYLPSNSKMHMGERQHRPTRPSRACRKRGDPHGSATARQVDASS